MLFGVTFGMILFTFSVNFVKIKFFVNKIFISEFHFILKNETNCVANRVEAMKMQFQVPSKNSNSIEELSLYKMRFAYQGSDNDKPHLHSNDTQ